jgi:hypothetical protein
VRIFFYLPISYAHNFFCKCRVMYITYSIRASYTHNLYIKNLLKKYKNEKKRGVCWPGGTVAWSDRAPNWFCGLVLGLSSPIGTNDERQGSSLGVSKILNRLLCEHF